MNSPQRWADDSGGRAASAADAPAAIELTECAVCTRDEQAASTMDEAHRARVYAARTEECEWEEAHAPWFLWHLVRYHGYRWWG